MGHNNVVLGYRKSIAPRVDGLPTGPPGFKASQLGIKA